jgi:hypothetical protein
MSDDEIRDGRPRPRRVGAGRAAHLRGEPEPGKSGSYLGPRIFNLANWVHGKDELFVPARQAMFEIGGRGSRSGVTTPASISRASISRRGYAPRRWACSAPSS